jgi:hypothetical protein
MTMTTNPGYQSSVEPILAEISRLSDSLCLTEACIRYILGFRTTAIPAKVPVDPNNPAINAVDVADAFVTVARAFHNFGVNIAPKEDAAGGVLYEPENCPTAADLDALAKAAGASVP